MVDKSFSATFAAGIRPQQRKDVLVQGNVSLTSASFWSNWFGSSNWSGKSVTVNSALQLSTVMACVRLISETLSTLPVGLFYRGTDGAPVAAFNHQLYYLLHSQPNASMTAVSFWQAFTASLLLDGNSYVEKRMSAGVVTSLEFLRPDCVDARKLASGAIEWRYTDEGKVRVIPEDRMWHTPAFTLDGVTGISPVRYGANVFGTAMATDQASADTFRNAMKSPGLVTMDAVLKGEQRDQIREHIRKVSADGGVMVLEKGSGFQQLAMNPQDAELLASRSFNIEEICRWFGVPPSMVGHGEKTSNWGTGVEQQMIGFVRFVLRPWCVRIEQSIRKNLLAVQEQLKYSAEFALEGMLRGDSSARAAFYSAMVNNGIMVRDECRRLENLSPMGGNASVLTVQSAMLPIDMLGQNQQPASSTQDALKNWLGITGKETP